MVTVEVKNLSKTFKIPHERRDSIREGFVNLFRPVSYEKFDAIKNLSFSVEKGDFFGIIGRNGSGKSTLLKMLAGIYSPTKGKVKIHGTIAPFLELGVGFNPELTGKENVYLNGTILGLSKKDIDTKYDEIVEFAGLEKFMDQKLKNYSSGMYVRLAFSVAIQADADVLLLDEVLAVGDADFQKKCYEVFRKLKKKGKTIIFVTHDLGEVRQFCNKVLYVKNGELMDIGDASSVIDKYIYEDKKDQPDVATNVDEKKKAIYSGSKEIEITKVEYLDKHGKNNENFISGDPVTIRVHYKQNKNISDVVCGIAVYKEDGAHIYGTNSFLQDKSIKLGNTGYVDFKTNALNLLSGNYALTVAFHSKDGRSYDWRDKKFYFNVANSSQDDGFIKLDFKFNS